MGLFGKLFEKKECAICGGEIGLLGNRKLEDGNMCKNCAAKLSPWMTDRRESTVEEIRRHLAYREENRALVPSMNPTRIYGTGTRVYIDEAKGKFFVTRNTAWREGNPDIIDIESVRRCEMEVREHKEELFHTDKDGKKVSFNPKRYKVSYRFFMHIEVESPYFSEISFQLSDTDTESPYNDAYREFERQGEELRVLLDPAMRQGGTRLMPGGGFSRGAVSRKDEAPNPAFGGPGAFSPKGAAPGMRDSAWRCVCGTVNSGRFCQNCGAPRPGARASFRCDQCGWAPEDGAHPPKFCPQCGAPFTGADRA